MNSARLVRGAVAAVLAAVVLTACSSDGENGVPRSWIRDKYTSNGGGWVDPDSTPPQVADAIHRHRAALDRASGDRSEFLRYGDDMVTVSPYGKGSLIDRGLPQRLPPAPPAPDQLAQPGQPELPRRRPRRRQMTPSPARTPIPMTHPRKATQ